MSAPKNQFSSTKPLLIGTIASLLLVAGFGGWACYGATVWGQHRIGPNRS
jgi:hypothetical protein